MKMILVLVIMLFLHVFADFNLQGILADMKQKAWWKRRIKDLDNTIYANDYKIALAVHAFMWTFVVTLPMVIFGWPVICGEFGWAAVKEILIYLMLIVANSMLHYVADDCKANEKSIDLATDQLVHVIQVCGMWLIWSLFVGW